MNVQKYISSGVIESFCLGFTTVQQNEVIVQTAALYPEVQEEIDTVRASLNSIVKEAAIKPRASVKRAVMNTIYTQQAQLYPQYVPLMHEPVDFERLYTSVKINELKVPQQSFENLYVQELPSTTEIINFAVWAKKGHEEEFHTDRMEYIAVLERSCDMFMNGEKTSFVKGDIITIPINVPHYAVITSAQPMFALVQRQLISN